MFLLWRLLSSSFPFCSSYETLYLLSVCPPPAFMVEMGSRQGTIFFFVHIGPGMTQCPLTPPLIQWHPLFGHPPHLPSHFVLRWKLNDSHLVWPPHLFLCNNWIFHLALSHIVQGGLQPLSTPPQLGYRFVPPPPPLESIFSLSG